MHWDAWRLLDVVRRLGIGAGILALLVMPISVQAQDITLDQVIQKAMDASFDLKIAQKGIEIGKSEISIARSEYFPTLQSRFNLEYLKDLENETRPVVAVGNSIIPTGTRYQNSIGLTLNHTLVDFGIRKRKVTRARKEVLAKVAAFDQTLRDLKLKLVDLYTEALIQYRSIKANEAILKLAEQGYQMKKRLHEAGSTSKVEVATEAIQVAQTMDDLETLRQELTQSLENISYYTQETYDAEQIVLADLGEEDIERTTHFNAMHTPESRQYDAQIEMKQQEIEMLRRQYLPQLSLYSYYNLYGFDPKQVSRSFGNLSQRTISLGLSVALPVFDGFKNKATIHKATLEKEKLVLEKAKVLAEIQYKANTLEQQADTQGVLLKTKATILNQTQEKLTMETRLSEQQLVDKTQAIQDHIHRVRRQLDMEKSLIQKISALKKLQIMEADT